MTEQFNTFTEYQLDLESAIQIAIEKLPTDLVSTRGHLVSATSCWDDVKLQQFWVMHWLNEKQLWRARTMQSELSNPNRPQIAIKGGGDMKVSVYSDGNVKYVLTK